MNERWKFERPEGVDAPKGPSRALKEAVALLAPFLFVLPDLPGLDVSELRSAEPKLLAKAKVSNLAEDLNSWLDHAKHAPRTKDIDAKLRNFAACFLMLVASSLRSTI